MTKTDISADATALELEDILAEISPDLLEQIAGVFDDGMRGVFAIGSGFNLISLLSKAFSHSHFFTDFGPFWNFFDAVGGFAQAGYKISKYPYVKRGRVRKAVDFLHDIFQSSQLICLTMPLTLALAGVGGASFLATGAALAAFSFAGCMWGCLGNAIYNCYLAKKKCDPAYFVEDRIEKANFVRVQQETLQALLDSYKRSIDGIISVKPVGATVSSGYVAMELLSGECSSVVGLADSKEGRRAQLLAIKQFNKLLKAQKIEPGKVKASVPSDGLGESHDSSNESSVPDGDTRNPTSELTRLEKTVKKEIAGLEKSKVRLTKQASLVATHYWGKITNMSKLERTFKRYELGDGLLENGELSPKQKNYAIYQLQKQRDKVDQGFFNIMEWGLAAVGMTVVAAGVVTLNPVVLAAGFAISGVAAGIKVCQFFNKRRSKNRILKPALDEIRKALLNINDPIFAPAEGLAGVTREELIRIEIFRQVVLAEGLLDSEVAHDKERWIERYFVCKNQLQYLEKPLKF